MRRFKVDYKQAVVFSRDESLESFSSKHYVFMDIVDFLLTLRAMARIDGAGLVQTGSDLDICAPVTNSFTLICQLLDWINVEDPRSVRFELGDVSQDALWDNCRAQYWVVDSIVVHCRGSDAHAPCTGIESSIRFEVTAKILSSNRSSKCVDASARPIIMVKLSWKNLRFFDTHVSVVFIEIIISGYLKANANNIRIPFSAANDPKTG